MPGGILLPGRHELANELVEQLQNAIDQLKHGTEPDQKVINEVRRQVPPAPWLKLKNQPREH